MAKEIAEEYASSLADLTVNSKPLINMLTILAEENIDHAGVIVETVEKHLEKVSPDIKLPVLYLVDSIIKNVGGAYTQKFSQSIVNMFTKTFKQVDEKIRSQMFKLRETWHDVFPATKLYQLDVKVNLIDPAWPIQAQPHQANIHVNPNFLKKSATSTATVDEDEKMRSILAKKEQELLMLQKKKVEMELEHMKRQLELDKLNNKKVVSSVIPGVSSPSMPIAMVNPVVAPALTPDLAAIPVKQRLGPPVSKPANRIAPVSGALVAARRDPRLARVAPAPAAPPLAPALLPPAVPPVPIAPNVFDIKPLDRVTKRKNVITIDVPRRRDPRLDKRRQRAERPDRAERPERPDRTERSEKLERPEKAERPDRGPRPERPDRNDRPEKVDRVERVEKPDRAEKSPRPEPAERAEPAEQPPAAPPAPDLTAIDKMLPDVKKISRLPPIPKLPREERASPPPPAKRKKEAPRDRKKRDEGSHSDPDKRTKSGRRRGGAPVAPGAEAAPAGTVEFKALRNYHKERYMRRNRARSASAERDPAEPTNVPEVVVENKDVDLRVLPAVADPKPAAVAQKRHSTDAAEGKPKKNKLDKFDILFGNEDVDLRQLPQVEDANPPPPPNISESPKSPKEKSSETEEQPEASPKRSPKKDWQEVKEKKDKDLKKTPTKLDLVRAKLAEATKGKDRLGRPLLFSKSPSLERERRRTLSSEDTDLRGENSDEFDAEDHKKTISIIMSQAKEQYSDGQLDKNQYNALMYQVLQLNEKLKLKEAKQRESLEISKRKLKAHTDEGKKVASPKSSPKERNNFGDIDERITPSVFVDAAPDGPGFMQDSDMRKAIDGPDGPNMLPRPPMPMFMGGNMPAFGPMWRGQLRPRTDDLGPRRFRGPSPPFFRAKFDKRGPRPPFDQRMPMPHLPTPQLGTCQGECPLQPYERAESPPPLGAPGVAIPPTDFKIIEYIDQDPVKTIQIDGIPREIRFYGDTAIIMLDWDDPREIKFLPGCRRVTFDNKDSVVLSFNEGYKQIEIEDQVFDIKFGAPTRELYINKRWHECFFGGNPLGVIIDGKPRLVHLEGPLPQVDIGKEKRTDLVAGKINLIVNATQMCPVYLDAKVQKFVVNNQIFTIRFVDALRTVLINEQPFKVEFGDLPKPIFIGSEKHFIRFSALPRNVRPGHVKITGMEGSTVSAPQHHDNKPDEVKADAMEVDDTVPPLKSPSPDNIIKENQGLDMLASVMPTTMEFASGSDYSVGDPFYRPATIPGLETPVEEQPPAPSIPGLGNINVTDLFAKLVATGIVQVPAKTEVNDKPDDPKPKPKEDKNFIHKVDLLKPETLRIKQPGVVSRLYGGMQCSGCGCRFPPEQTVRYSQHLDWHFRQNRRERESARRAHSRHWHYDLADWLQYEELEEVAEREAWFEPGAEAPPPPAAAAPSVPAGAPAVAHCALCGDAFQQFYNEDREEWHLRNSVTHNGQNYHPICYEDYKASLTKEEPTTEPTDGEVVSVDKTEEAIEIKDLEEAARSDEESDVELVDTEKPIVEQVELLEEEEDLDDGDDDVVLKAEPVEQVVVEDADTDDETAATRAQRDTAAAFDIAHVKIKQEPIDPDDEPIITAEEEHTQPPIETTIHNTISSSIDGNLQFSDAGAPAALPAGGIRINISKTITPTFITNHDDDKLDDISADDQPLPPGEEPELEYTLKPAIEGVQLSRQPPVQKGNELSGLCSIM